MDNDEVDASLDPSLDTFVWDQYCGVMSQVNNLQQIVPTLEDLIAKFQAKLNEFVSNPNQKFLR
jgi:hypothetical protein